MTFPPPTLLTSADYDVIRQSIRADITANDLPDPVVQSVFNFAVLSVLEVDPAAGTWAAGSAQAQADHDAAVMFAAALAAGLIPQITRENFQGYSYAIQPIDPAARAEALRAAATQLLALALGVDMVTLMRPRQFALADGGRGDVSDSSPSNWLVGNLPEGWP